MSNSRTSVSLFRSPEASLLMSPMAEASTSSMVICWSVAREACSESSPRHPVVSSICMDNRGEMFLVSRGQKTIMR